MTRILIDSAGDNLPTDVTKMLESIDAERSAVRTRGGPGSSAVVLERWSVAAHAYSEDIAAKMSLLFGLFSIGADRVRAGIVHEAKRFTLRKGPDGREYELGVAVRLSVATISEGLEGELTLPDLTANAQLNRAEARVGLSVVGYNGALGDLLPAPSKLDVDTCIKYVDSFSRLQALVFGEKGAPHVVPTMLSYGDPAKTVQAPKARTRKKT